MIVSYQDSKKYSIDSNKLAVLTLADRYFYRPIAIAILPFLFNALRLTPNKISILSMILVSVAFCFIGFANNTIFAIIGCIFLIAFMILDCADGSLARTLFYKYKVKNPLGEFFDAFVGYFVIAGLWTSLGYFLSVQTNNNIWFVLGVLSSLASLYSRTAYLKLGWIKCEQGLDRDKIREIRLSFAMKFYKNLDWGGFLLFIIPVSIWFNFMEYILVTMMFVNFSMLAWMFRHAYQQAKLFPMYQVED